MLAHLLLQYFSGQGTAANRIFFYLMFRLQLEEGLTYTLWAITPLIETVSHSLMGCGFIPQPCVPAMAVVCRSEAY